MDRTVQGLDVVCNSDAVTKIIRLGKKNADKYRIVRVTLKSVEVKSKLMEKSKRTAI